MTYRTRRARLLRRFQSRQPQNVIWTPEHGWRDIATRKPMQPNE